MDREDEAEYAAWVDQAWPTLVRAAVFLGAQPHEAEDLAQTTLVRCYTGWERVSNADNRDAYVYRMLLNTLRDVRRTRWWKDRVSTSSTNGAGWTNGAGATDGGRPDGFDQRLAPTPDASDAVATADAVHRALGGLSVPNRAVVVLRYFVQLTEKQTAEVLGIAPGTVKSRLSRSLAQLATDDHLLDLDRA